MLGRQYGLASDQIVALDMVDADGNLITADAKNNSDLLFASQGLHHLLIFSASALLCLPLSSWTDKVRASWTSRSSDCGKSDREQRLIRNAHPFFSFPSCSQGGRLQSPLSVTRRWPRPKDIHPLSA